MIDTGTIAVAAITVLIAAIATVLRRKFGFIAVVWAIAFGFAIAAHILKVKAEKYAKETAMRTRMMVTELEQQLQAEMEEEMIQPPASPYGLNLPLQIDQTEETGEEDLASDDEEYAEDEDLTE